MKRSHVFAYTLLVLLVGFFAGRLSLEALAATSNRVTDGDLTTGLIVDAGQKSVTVTVYSPWKITEAHAYGLNRYIFDVAK